MARAIHAHTGRPWAWKDFLLLLGSVVFCFFLLELLYSLYLSYKPTRIQLYDSPYSFFDPDTGYALLPGDKRCVSFMGGKLLWKTTIRPNNLGYNAGYDYQTKKPSAQLKRFIILGDSFTAGDNMDITWAEQFNQLLKPLGGEAYAFSQQAIGLDNWYGMFFKQIVPSFEFDALILACYHNDLSRLFTIFHTEDNTTYYTRTKTPPKTKEEFLSKTLPKMVPLFSNTTAEKVDRMLADPGAVEKFSWRWAGFSFHLTRKLLATIRAEAGSRTALYERFHQDAPLRSLAEVADSDPDFFRLTKLWDILNWCKANRKPVILCSIPDIERIGPYITSEGKFLGENQRNLTSIAQHYEVEYFDGYAVYLGNSLEDIRKKYWPQEELHWGQEGAHLFARRLADMVEQKWAQFFVTQ